MPFSSRSLRAAWWALAAVLFSSCLSPRPPTQVVVYVEAQPLVREETAMLEVAVRAGPRGDLTPLADTYVYEVADGDVYPRDFTFVPLGGDLTRIFEVEATAYDASRRIITVARLRAGFVEHEARTLRLTLEDRCRGIVCPSGATCRGGRCVQLVDPTQDAGMDLDAGVPDDAPTPPCDDDGDCDDGVFCNGIEQCKSGECQPGDVVDCDDGIDCTEDVCSGGGCNHLPDPSVCTAGPDPSCDPTNGCQYSICNTTLCASTGCVTATCEGMLCRRTPLCGGASPLCCGGACVPAGCDDGLSCTNDYCDESAPSTAGCVHEPIEGACDDGDACTGDGTCRGERCVAAAPIDCNDANPCTDDSCDTVAGCLHVADDTNVFDDGDACTVGDRCAAGVAVPGAGRVCDDGVACTRDECVGGTCQFTPMDALCTAGTSGRCDRVSGCQYGTCNAATCIPTNNCEMADCVGTTCDRRPLCPGGVCCNGVCCSEDSNPCTTAACVAGGGCGFMNNSLGCNDSNPCTNGDTCAGGTCSGTPVVCPPLGGCRTNTCGMGGTCVPGEVTDGTPCDVDGNRCTNDVCARGTCVGGSAMVCSDLTLCTVDRCNPTTGMCEFPFADPGAPCGIQLDCTSYACDGGGLCVPSGCMSGEVCCMGSYCSPIGDCQMGCFPPGTC